MSLRGEQQAAMWLCCAKLRPHPLLLALQEASLGHEGGR